MLKLILSNSDGNIFFNIVRSYADIEHHIGFSSALDTFFVWTIFGYISTPNWCLVNQGHTFISR